MYKVGDRVEIRLGYSFYKGTITEVGRIITNIVNDMEEQEFKVRIDNYNETFSFFAHSLQLLPTDKIPCFFD